MKPVIPSLELNYMRNYFLLCPNNRSWSTARTVSITAPGQHQAHPTRPVTSFSGMMSSAFLEINSSTSQLTHKNFPFKN